MALKTANVYREQNQTAVLVPFRPSHRSRTARVGERADEGLGDRRAWEPPRSTGTLFPMSQRQPAPAEQPDTALGQHGHEMEPGPGRGFPRGEGVAVSWGGGTVCAPRALSAPPVLVVPGSGAPPAAVTTAASAPVSRPRLRLDSARAPGGCVPPGATGTRSGAEDQRVWGQTGGPAPPWGSWAWRGPWGKGPERGAPPQGARLPRSRRIARGGDLKPPAPPASASENVNVRG